MSMCVFLQTRTNVYALVYEGRYRRAQMCVQVSMGIPLQSRTHVYAHAYAHAFADLYTCLYSWLLNFFLALVRVPLLMSAQGSQSVSQSVSFTHRRGGRDQGDRSGSTRGRGGGKAY